MLDFLDLYDYRRRVAVMYRKRAEALQSGEDAALVLQRFREARDALFATHPQSALDEEQRKQFEGLRYFPYNSALSVTANVETTIEPTLLTVAMNAEEFAICLARQKAMEVGATSSIPSRGATFCLYVVLHGKNVSCWTSIMPTNHRARTIINGFAHWHLWRIGCTCQFAPVN